MSRLPVPLLGFPNERMFGEGLYECRHGHRTFFVEEGTYWGHGGYYQLFIQPEKETIYYDNILMVYTHIHNAIEEMENAERSQVDASSGENVERHP